MNSIFSVLSRVKTTRTTLAMEEYGRSQQPKQRNVMRVVGFGSSGLFSVRISSVTEWRFLFSCTMEVSSGRWWLRWP